MKSTNYAKLLVLIAMIAPVNFAIAQQTTKALTHSVIAGDRLSDIADRYTGNIDNWRDIAAFNNMRHPLHLKLDTVIEIPVNLIPGYGTALDDQNQSASQNKETATTSPTKRKSRITFEADIEQNANANWNFNLEQDNEQEIVTLEPEISLAMKYKASKNISAYLSLKYAREMETEITEDSRERSYRSTLELDEMYLRFSNLFKFEQLIKNTSMTVGRFKLDDNREWFYDENLDGVLLSFELEAIDTELDISINKNEIIGSDLLSHDKDDTVENYILTAEHKPINSLDMTLSAHAIVRDDQSNKNESPRIYGLSSNGKLADDQIYFWTDVAWARGKDGDENIKGRGLDVGVTFIPTKLGVNLTISYAYGSGNGDRDTDFRQTGLEGNSDKFAGVASFKYYGELFDPELSNMHIYTAGIGYRFSKTASLDIVYHRYKQDSALDKLRGGDIDADPDGQNKELGSEIDVVFGYTTASNIDTEIVLSYFEPGAAYGDNADDAAMIKASIGYSF